MTDNKIGEMKIDVFIFALGYETRATSVAACITQSAQVFALQMERQNIFSYSKNWDFAKTRRYKVVEDAVAFLQSSLPRIIGRHNKKCTIAVDISSMDRVLMTQIMLGISRNIRPNCRLLIFYRPARFSSPPEVDFPPIERMAAIDLTLTGFDAGPTLPLALLIGAGFVPGITHGVFDALEPSKAYCFWGSGVDEKFDSAVKKANFSGLYAIDEMSSIRYLVTDPISTFLLLESLVFRLIQDYKVVLIPMGPKIFAFVSILVAMHHLGKISLWRLQLSNETVTDAVGIDTAVCMDIDVSALIRFKKREFDIFGMISGE